MMQVHFGIELLKAEWKNAVACIGTFDGVHRGHQEVIRQAVEQAREAECPCILITFDRHPAAVLAPDRCPPPISSLQENLRAFESLGVSVAVILHFDAELSRMSAQRFLDDVIIEACKAHRLVVGHDFAMGQNREGNTDWLSTHIPTSIVAPYEIDGARVSSSGIREAISGGDVARAEQLLGRAFSIFGVVVSGAKLGRQLGFPTANLARSFQQVMPADGIYAGRLTSDQGTYRAAISIGIRPAIESNDRTIEAYLLDYPGGSLYGLPVRLELCDRLREQRHFEEMDQLKEQIVHDVELIRSMQLS